MTTQKKINEHALSLHRKAVVIDMHSDVHLDVVRARGRGETRVLERRHLPNWKTGGVDMVVLNTIPRFSPTPYPYATSPVKNTLLIFDAVLQEIAESPRHFTLILEPPDILRAKKEGKIGLMLGIEGAEAVEDNIGLLRAYHRLGLRVMNLTWHQRNLAADGVAEPSNAGLSNFGRELVREMNRLGILIDVSHLAPAGVADVLRLSDAPVMASHSNVKAVRDHERNLDDNQIMDITSKGGMIGVVFLGRFVAEKNPTLEHVINHIDHIAGLAGGRHIGIGPDYTDYAEDMVIGARRIAGPNQPVNDATIPYAKGLENASKLPNLTKGLAQRGYDDKTIADILGGNFLDLFTTIRSKVNARKEY